MHMLPNSWSHKPVCAAVSDVLKNEIAAAARFAVENKSIVECRVNNYDTDLGVEIAISSGFSNVLFPMNLKRPPITTQEVQATNEILYTDTHTSARDRVAI